MSIKTKEQLKGMLKKASKGNVKLKHKKVGRWDRYYLFNKKTNKWDSSAYYTQSKVARMIKYGQIKSIQ